MKRALFVLLPLVFALSVVAWIQLRQSRSRLGYPAPDFTLFDLGGRKYTLSHLRGSVVFLNLWATWCPPCREEMPSMEKLHRQLAGERFVMLAVSEDADGAAAVAPFVAEMKVTFPVLLDPLGNLPHRLGITGYPETFIVDPAGNIVQHFIGPYDWTDPRYLEYFRSLMNPPTAQP
jgi:thiol-disulfide isomerase/thioredoxin